MKNAIRRTTGLLGAALIASQLMGASSINSSSIETVRNQGTSAAFGQAAPETPAQLEVDKLLKQIHSNAALAARHASNLDSFARGVPAVKFESHAEELNRVKHAINEMGADLQRLQALRPTALPWQQLVIDRIEPVLSGLANHATGAIQYANENRHWLQAPEYRETVANLYGNAAQARELISITRNYAQAREKLNGLDGASFDAAVTEAAPVSSKASKSLEQRVRAELLNLPYYGVFDYLALLVNGDEVVLNGQVHWAPLKMDAERAVRGVEGVASLRNNIEVLPVSPNDDAIRMAAYQAIYGHAMLTQYRLNPNPPIRIIVNKGHVTLIGVVGSDMDRTIAHMQANGVPGTFSVTNNLQVGS